MEGEDRWTKLENIVRRVVREELTAKRKPRNEKSAVKFENGQWTGITKEQMSAWSSAYPAVDIEQELRLAAAHILSNPAKRPASDFARFLNSWIKRTQTHLSIRSIPMRSEMPVAPKSCSYCDRKSVGIFAGRLHCAEHQEDAMNQRPVLKRA